MAFTAQGVYTFVCIQPGSSEVPSLVAPEKTQLWVCPCPAGICLFVWLVGFWARLSWAKPWVRVNYYSASIGSKTVLWSLDTSKTSSPRSWICEWHGKCSQVFLLWLPSFTEPSFSWLKHELLHTFSKESLCLQASRRLLVVKTCLLPWSEPQPTALELWKGTVACF